MAPGPAQKVAIVGGSLAGLAAAHVLLRNGAEVTVFEKSSDGFAKRGACLGFVDVDMLEKIRGAKFIRNGRRATLEQGAFYYGDVWQFLFSGLPAGCVKFGRTVSTLGADVWKPTVDDGETFDLVIIADGLSSFEREFGSTETATYSNGCYDAVVLEAPKCDGSRMYACGFFVATPESEIASPATAATGDNRQVEATRSWSVVPDWFLPFIRRMFGQYVDGEIVRFSEAAARKGKIAPNPVYEFAASKTVAGRVVAIGDAVHLATPWTAAGAHTALMDAVSLGDVFAAESHGRRGRDMDRALSAYDKGAVKRAKSLLLQSRACSRRLLPRAGKRAVPSPATLV
jgi:2-polyprenyl-6-methoxyphenol hydroxylase-like FAD-dependent oxidoreductase